MSQEELPEGGSSFNLCHSKKNNERINQYICKIF